MPPSNLNDFQSQFNSIMRKLDDVEISETSEVFLLCHSEDLDKTTGLIQLQTDLKSKLESTGISVKLITENDMSRMSRISAVINSAVIIVCVTPKLNKSVDCTNFVAYLKHQTHKQLILALFVEANDDWRESQLGMLFPTDLRVDFWDLKRYEDRLSGLITRVSARKDRLISAQFPPVFISYCWSNSRQAIAKGSKSIPQAIGEVDPREIKDFLCKNGVDCWLDVEQTGNNLGLYENIAEGLRHARLVLACVSDEYWSSKVCMQEYHFSTIVLQRPIILCPVGKGNNWQTSEIALLALNCPRVDCHVKRYSERQRLLKLVRETLERPPIPTGNTGPLQNSSKTEEKKSAAEPFEVYQELVELAERKFLQHISLLAPKIRNYLGLWDVYPRLFFLDFVTKPSENSRPLSAGGQSQFFSQTNTAIRLLCEDEKGWHIVNKSVKFNAAVVTDDFEKILDEISTFQLNLLTIMKHSASCDANLFRHPNVNDIVKNFEERAKKGPTIQVTINLTLQQSYSKLTEIVYKLDVGRGMGRVRGEMRRCYLPSRKLVWLCRHHQSSARATLPNEDVEAEDVQLEYLELTAADIDAKPNVVDRCRRSLLPTTPISKTESNENPKIEKPPHTPVLNVAGPNGNAKAIERPRRSSIKSARSSNRSATNSPARTAQPSPKVIIQPAAAKVAEEKKKSRLCLIM